MPINFEIKAKYRKLDIAREILKAQNAEYKGTNQQTDTYFHSKNGSLKLRESQVENSLTQYDKDIKHGNTSDSLSFAITETNSKLKAILDQAIGKKCVIEKERETYVIDQLNFHLDTVKNLGTFIKISPAKKKHDITKEYFQEQCNVYIKLLQINAKDILSTSYQEMIQQNNLFSQILFDE